MAYLFDVHHYHSWHLVDLYIFEKYIQLYYKHYY